MSDTFRELFFSYPYLWASSLDFVLFIVLGKIFLPKRQFRIMRATGLAGTAPFAFLILLEYEYWSPRRVGGWILGIEDLICSFIVAAMTWFCVGIYFKDRVTFAKPIRKFWMRYWILAVISVSLFVVIFFVFKIMGMSALILATGLLAVYLLLRKLSHWPLALAGILIFPLVYLTMTRFEFWLWPDFVEQWSKTLPWGRRIVGLPLGEITWSIVFGAYWPLFTAYIFDAKLTLARENK
jgi:hypothetical protein